MRRFNRNNVSLHFYQCGFFSVSKIRRGHSSLKVQPDITAVEYYGLPLQLEYSVSRIYANHILKRLMIDKKQDQDELFNMINETNYCGKDFDENKCDSSSKENCVIGIIIVRIAFDFYAYFEHYFISRQKLNYVHCRFVFRITLYLSKKVNTIVWLLMQVIYRPCKSGDLHYIYFNSF